MQKKVAYLQHQSAKTQKTALSYQFYLRRVGVIGLGFHREFEESYSSQCFLYLFQKSLGQNYE